MLAGGTIVDWDDFGDAGQLFVLDDEYDLSTVIAVPVPVSASGSFGGIDVPSPPTEYLLPAGWLEVFGLTVSDSNANYWILSSLTAYDLDDNYIGDVYRENEAWTVEIGWWFSDSDFRVHGVVTIDEETEDVDLNLRAGWNRVVSTLVGPDEWRIRTGSEPSGVRWEYYEDWWD